MRIFTPLLLASALALSSCGYTPLYVPLEGQQATANRVQIGKVAMEKVDHNVGERRVAQTVSQRLQLAFPNSGTELDTVEISIWEDTSTLAVEETATVQRAQINLRGTFTITSPQGQRLLQASANTSAAYNVETTPYGTEAGKTSARQTAARTLADEISRRLDLFYRTHPAAAPAQK